MPDIYWGPAICKAIGNTEVREMALTLRNQSPGNTEGQTHNDMLVSLVCS